MSESQSPKKGCDGQVADKESPLPVPELRTLVLRQVGECLEGLPNHLKIGPHDWAIGRIIEESDLCGQADFAVHHLKLWPLNLNSPAHAVGILLHETLHVIFEQHKRDKLPRDKEEREESIVTAYEIGLVSLFRDNPKFVNWMKKWLR